MKSPGNNGEAMQLASLATRIGPATEQARAILDLVLRYEIPLVQGVSAAENEVHLRKLKASVERNQPVRMVLPAFPAKSPNREKTASSLPDYGEVLGLLRLQNLCDEISALHAPGAEVVICSDGRVFSDLVLVSDSEVSAYGEGIREIIEDFQLTSLSTFGMEEVFEERDFAGMRSCLVEKFGRPVHEVRAAVLGSPSGLSMFNGIHRFIFEDRLVLFPELSRTKVREESKDVALRVIQRSNAWSALVEEFFPEALRLSIHPQAPSTAKIGFQLVSCGNRWGTPWHNVALNGPEGFRLVKRKEAEEAGAELAFIKGKYSYYSLEGGKA